jgi:putative lipoprotein
MFMLVIRLSAVFIAIAVSASVIEQALSSVAQQSAADPVPSRPPSQSTPQSPAPTPHPLSRSSLHFALPRRAYLSDSGARIVNLIETNAARLALNEHIYNMKQVETACGTKYAKGRVVWSSDGDDGFLEDNTVAGKPQMLATNGHLQNVHPPVAAAAGRITGTVRFRHRVALPPDAIVLVHLQDVFLPDAPSPFLAESKTTLGARQAPIPFTLKFDPAKIDPKHPYVVEASILVHNQLRFTNDTAYLVLTQGHPAKVAMILVEVDAPAGTKP